MSPEESLFDAAILSDASESTWQDAFQRLKPGAHALGVGNHELWDLMSAAARAAGFEVRDSIAVQAPGPSWYPIMIFRKPIEEKTVAAQVLATGTGVMNIDGTRVKHSSQADLEQHRAGVEAIKARGGSMENSWKNSSDLSGASDVTSAGRWPPNFVLVHSPECRNVGDRKIKAITGTLNGSWRTGGQYGGGWAGADEKDLGKPIGSGDEDGMGTVAAWECSPECPSKALDRQSGVTTSGAMKREVDAYDGKSNTGFLRGRSGPSNQHGDSGTASRFYPQFQDTSECVENCPAKKLDGQSGFLKSGNLDPSRIQAKNKIYGPRKKKQDGQYEQNEGTASRFYPQFQNEPNDGARFFTQFTDTISPGLLDWLVKLICPEGGRVLTSEGLSYETNR